MVPGCASFNSFYMWLPSPRAAFFFRYKLMIYYVWLLKKFVAVVVCSCSCCCCCCFGRSCCGCCPRCVSVNIYEFICSLLIIFLWAFLSRHRLCLLKYFTCDIIGIYCLFRAPSSKSPLPQSIYTPFACHILLPLVLLYE